MTKQKKINEKLTNLNKIALLIIFMHLTGCNAVNAASLTPLKEYCLKNDIKKDKAAFGYVCLRCSALYGITQVMMGCKADNEKDNKNKHTIQSYEERFKQMGEIFFSSYKIIANFKDNKTAEIQRSKIFSAYADDCEKNYIASGNFIEDGYIMEDLKICKNIMENFKEYAILMPPK